ncbi:hypothetical protein Gogos_016455, partial [Gossypium gossypioides]|nr:hypothetical protein [Gossypium gossypioides]
MIRPRFASIQSVTIPGILSLFTYQLFPNVNQWMQKTVSNLLMFIGSNFNSLAMPGLRIENWTILCSWGIICRSHMLLNLRALITPRI